MKPIDKLKGNILVSYDNFTGLINEIHFKPYTDKLNQLISSHNELIKIINKLNKE